MKNFNSNEECAAALYKQLVLAGEIDINDDYYTENSILHDINNLRGYEWLQCLQRNIDTEPFFAYLDPEYVPHFYGDGALLEDTFICDISITPKQYWQLATGENVVVIDSLETLRNMMDEAGLGEVWDYPMEDVDEAVENNEHLVLVEEGELSDYSANNCRVFEVTDEMFERFQELYGQKDVLLGNTKLDWKAMSVKYPEAREDMSPERERKFVNDCFDIMEHEGFSDKFWSPFGDYKERFGEMFKVVERCTEKHCDLEVLPMWNIQFTDGTIIGAYPEEIVPSAMKEHGCPYFNEPSLVQKNEEASRRNIQSTNNYANMIHKERKFQPVSLSNEELNNRAEFLENFFWAQHITMGVDVLDGHLVATDDEGNIWTDEDVYDFALNECLAFNEDGSLSDGLGAAEPYAERLKADAKVYGVEITSIVKSVEGVIADAQGRCNDAVDNSHIKNAEREILK